MHRGVGIIGLVVILARNDLLFESDAFVAQVLLEFAEIRLEVGVTVVILEQGVGTVQQ